MPLDILLSRLDGVKRTRHEKWIAKCPAHNDRNPSLTIKETDDGRVLIYCFAGCGAAEILDALDLNFSDLFPSKPINGHSMKRVRNPWNASDVLQALAFEVLLAWNYAKQMHAGQALTDADQARLLVCATRLLNGLGVINE